MSAFYYFICLWKGMLIADKDVGDMKYVLDVFFFPQAARKRGRSAKAAGEGNSEILRKTGDGI